MIMAMTIYKRNNTVIFHHYHTSKQYDITPDIARWLENRAKLDGWKHKPNGYTFNGSRYVRITSDNDPVPYYSRPGLRFETIVINWSRKTIRFTDLYHKDHTYTVKSVKRLRKITALIDSRNQYNRYDSESWSNYSRKGRKLEKYTSYTVR